MLKIHRIYTGSGWLHTVHCLSTDTKPTSGIVNGSTCVEIDTGKVYRFDEENSRWIEQPQGSGGGLPAAGEMF